MKPSVPVPELLDGRPFTVGQAAAWGVSRRRLMTSPLWRPICRGVHVSAETPDTALLRVAAATLVLPAGCVVAGASSLWLQGVDVRRSVDEPIQVVSPPSRRPPVRRGLIVARPAKLDDADVTTVDGIAVTTALRSAFDLARRDLTEAVVALDALRRARLLGCDDLMAYAQTHPGLRGVRQVSRVVALSDAGAESPQESRLRMLLVIDAGLPRPLTQYELRDASGCLIARFDVAYPEAVLGVDFHGRWHDQPRQRLKDTRRDNRVQRAQWTHLHYWGDDLAARRHVIVREVSGHLGIESTFRYSSAS